MKFVRKVALASVAVASLMLMIVSVPAQAQGASFDQLFQQASGDGPCQVKTESGSGSTFYVPSGGTGTYNIVGWGNGTGGASFTYRSLLTRLASHCVLVAAANTSQSGSGRQVQTAVTTAKSRYASIVGSNPLVCTSGHSQGGGGSFNAARLLNADCVIPVQADTVFTTQIRGAMPATTKVIATWGSADALANRRTNERNTSRNSTIYVSVESRGEGHFAPTGAGGGKVGTLQRMAALAMVSTDPAQRATFGRAFFGPDNASTVTSSSSNLSFASRNDAAKAVDPGSGGGIGGGGITPPPVGGGNTGGGIGGGIGGIGGGIGGIGGGSSRPGCSRR